MSFEKWENRMHDAYVGSGEHKPDEDCPCGCGGDYDECEYDPDEADAEAEADYLLDRYDDPSDPFNG